MKRQIRTYLTTLSEEIKSKIKNDFNLEEPLFTDFQLFDFVNFFLIREYILNDSSNKKDLFIGIPEKEYREYFFESILNSLTIIKLFQNFFNYEKANPEIEVGDLIYFKRKKESRVLKVKSKIGDTYIFTYRFPKRNEENTDLTINQQNFIFTKLNPNLVENKNTVKKIDEYNKFLNLYFGDNFPLLTDFQKKAIVIAEKDFFKESDFLPIKYTAKTGKSSNNLPFFNFMIECCNDYQTAKKYLTSNLESFDEIIVIGDSKYRETFTDILQELKWQNKINNIILIGTEKTNTQNEFIEWHWSKDEIILANNETPPYLQKQIIENSPLLEKLIELKSEIALLQSEKEVDISFILKYTNYYFRNIIADTPLSKGYHQEYCDRLSSYFKSEKFEDELNKQFYNSDIYRPDIIKENTDKIFKKFQEISAIIETRNLKWDCIKQRAKELTNKNLHIIVEKKSYSAISNQIKNNKIPNIKLISDKRIDNQTDYLQSWINDDTKNTANRQYIIPYLNNAEIFDLLRQLKGDCKVLCYKDIDEISFDNLVQNFYTQEKKRLTHEDRNCFVKSIFSEDIQYLQRQLDDLFRFDFNNESFKNNSYESIDLPKEKIQYEILFTDESIDKFESSKGIFLIDGSEQINTTIGEIYEGATIRFYQNNNPREFRKILKILDEKNLLETFNYYSESWKNTLKKILEKNNNDLNVVFSNFKKIKNISYNTLQRYFNDNIDTKFPVDESLNAIKQLCIQEGLENELIVTEFYKFTNCASGIRSISIKAANVLKNEIFK